MSAIPSVGSIGRNTPQLTYFWTWASRPKTPRSPTGGVGQFVGIDLGPKDFAATRDAKVITLDRQDRRLEEQLAKAQHAGKKARVCVLHPKIKNPRKDQLHELSTALVKPGAIRTYR